MEEVDNILVQQLREIGCEFDDEINGIKDMEVYEIMSCICHCISLIDSNYSNQLSVKGVNQSMNMSLKYKIATQLANICTNELGYNSEVGYQTFLYGNETDVRKLFLFLLERLPKDDEENRITSIVTTGLTSNNIINRIKRLKINTFWLPFMTDLSQNKDKTQIKAENVNNFWSLNTNSCKIVSVKSVLMNKVAPNRQKYYHLSLKLPNSLPSIMEWNCLLLNNETNDNLFINKSKKVSIETISESNENIDIINEEYTYGSLISNDLNNKDKQLNSFVENDDKVIKEGKEFEKINKLSNELKINLIIEDLERDLINYEQEIANHKCLENKLKEYELNLKEESKRLQELEANDKTKRELMSEINEVKQDIENMSQKWQQIQNVLSDRLKQLKFESEAKNERSTALQRQMNELKKSITSKVKEIKSKESLIEELTEKLPQEWPPSRSSYTKRILEIVANVKKQNQETKKVLLETKALQKEINNLSGKLSRTFTVADEEIFKDAKTNEWNRKCYKLLASMHEHCDQLLEAVSNIGFILREIRQLEESVETERSRKTSSNLNRILADFDQIKLENQQLIKKLNL